MQVDVDRCEPNLVTKLQVLSLQYIHVIIVNDGFGAS